MVYGRCAMTNLLHSVRGAVGICFGLCLVLPAHPQGLDPNEAAACPGLAAWYEQKRGNEILAPAQLRIAGTDAKLTSDLIDMARADKEARNRAIRDTQLGGVPCQLSGKRTAKSYRQCPMEVNRVVAVDKRNLKALRKLIAERGIPTEQRVGRKGMSAFWLLVQHAQDDALQEQVLKAISVKHSGIAPDPVALLTDRVRVHEGRPQVYGSQFHFAGKEFLPYPIEDEKNVDQRRKKVGLPPLADYACGLRVLYKVAPSK